MKEKIHPKWFEATVVCSCGNTFKTGSTRDKLHVEICSACHPFFTGNQKFVDTEGRVEKFMTKFGTVTSQKSKRKAKAEADAKAKAEAEAAAAAQAPAAQAHVEAVAEPATKKAAAKPKSTTPRRRTKAAKTAEESAEPEKVPAETPAS